LAEPTTLRDTTAESILVRLGDLEGNPDEILASYLEFSEGGELYYFTARWFSLPEGARNGRDRRLLLRLLDR
jgi:hypothetical protein